MRLTGKVIQWAHGGALLCGPLAFRWTTVVRPSFPGAECASRRPGRVTTCETPSHHARCVIEAKRGRGAGTAPDAARAAPDTRPADPAAPDPTDAPGGDPSRPPPRSSRPTSSKPPLNNLPGSGAAQPLPFSGRLRECCTLESGAPVGPPGRSGRPPRPPPGPWAPLGARGDVCPNLPQRPRSTRSAGRESLIFRASSRRRFRRGAPLWQIWTRPRSGPSQEPHAHHSASIPPTPPRRSLPMGRRAPKTHSTAPNNLPVRVRVITGRR